MVKAMDSSLEKCKMIENSVYSFKGSQKHKMNPLS